MLIKRTYYIGHITCGHMEVNKGGLEVGVTEKALDIKDIGARIQKMHSKGVPQAMDVAPAPIVQRVGS